MSKTLASDIIDITAQVPTMEAYRFLSTSGTLTIKGFFVDGQGHQVGSSFLGTVNTTEAETWEDISGATLDAEVVGFRGSFSVAAYYELLRGSETDFEANPTQYPQIPAGDDVRIGRVAMVDSAPNSVTLSGAVNTELPAAAALADNAATPTAPAVGAFGMVYDGSTWDMQRGTAADGTLVNLGSNNDVQGQPIQSYSFIPDGTDELLIDATARKFYGMTAFTIDATPIYVKVYDKASAASESDTPFDRMGVPANSTAANGAGNNKGVPGPHYVPLTNGLSVRVVTGIADNNDSAVTTAENLITVWWSA